MPASWLAPAATVVAALSGGGIATLLNSKANRRGLLAQAEGKAAAAATEAVGVVQRSLERLEKDLLAERQQREAAEQQIATLRNQLHDRDDAVIQLRIEVARRDARVALLERQVEHLLMQQPQHDKFRDPEAP